MSACSRGRLVMGSSCDKMFFGWLSLTSPPCSIRLDIQHRSDARAMYSRSLSEEAQRKSFVLRPNTLPRSSCVTSSVNIPDPRSIWLSGSKVHGEESVDEEAAERSRN